VGYYRQFLIAQELQKQGLAEVLINDFTYGENRLFCRTFHPECQFIVNGYENKPMVESFLKHLEEAHNEKVDPAKIESSIVGMVEPAPEMLSKIGHWADIIVFGRRDIPEYLSQWVGMREFFNVPIVMDTDDNVFATRPFNPGYRGYHPGAESLLWNRKTAASVDAVTTSTENLKQVHLRDNPNIYVIPNSLELDRWAAAVKPEHPEIRIGCLMSSSHHEDALLLKKVIPEILKKYPNVHFYYTAMYNYVFENEELKGQLHPLPWIALKNWPESVVEQGFDIGLAPLVDNMFNRAKSNLRYLEYSAARMATVCSPALPYKCVEHGKTGLVASNFEEWVQNISLLIEDQNLRNSISKAAFRYVSDNFDIKKNAKKTLKVYNDIIRGFEKKNGEPRYSHIPYHFQTSSLV
jgi:glycosyltransferase involved in cell wall biosynthesis